MFLVSLGLTLSQGLNFPLAIDRCEVFDEEAHKIRCFNDAEQIYCVYTTNACVGRTNGGQGPEKSELVGKFFPRSTRILYRFFQNHNKLKLRICLLQSALIQLEALYM